jgi:hypothetical protein
MGAPIQRLRHHISHWPLLGFLGRREPDPGSDDPDRFALDEVVVTFKECEGVCTPTAEQIEAKERERADQFKGDQLLPILGLGGGSPSPPS